MIYDQILSSILAWFKLESPGREFIVFIFSFLLLILLSVVIFSLGDYVMNFSNHYHRNTSWLFYVQFQNVSCTFGLNDSRLEKWTVKLSCRIQSNSTHKAYSCLRPKGKINEEKKYIQALFGISGWLPSQLRKLWKKKQKFIHLFENERKENHKSTVRFLCWNELKLFSIFIIFFNEIHCSLFGIVSSVGSRPQKHDACVCILNFFRSIWLILWLPSTDAIQFIEAKID